MSKRLVCLIALCLFFVASAGGAETPKKVLFEYWLDIGGGTSVAKDLRTNANFPAKPTQTELRDTFKGYVDWKDNYGDRARAYLTPPESGAYTFWISGDDNCELWLSSDDKPSNARLIAQVASWTGNEEWGKEAGQKTVVTLTKGQRYYIEALHKEGGGGDSMTVAWGGPGIGAGPKVITGDYVTAPDPATPGTDAVLGANFATAPQPASGATEISSPLFQWTAGATAVMHEVYMGTNPAPGAAEFMGPWPTNMYFHIPGLTPGATYYWRVDEVDATGAKFPGLVWSFAVQPLEAHQPDPSDGMMGRALDVKLKWLAGQGAVKHKVFLGADQAKVTAGDASVLAAEQAEVTFAPAALVGATAYYWRVDEVDSTGKVTAGPVWSFSTIDPAGGAIAEYWNINSNFFNASANVLGEPVVVKTVPNVNFSWPSGSAKGTNSPDAAINTDRFRARFTAQLNVPVSGKYKLIESTDDGGLVYLNGDLVAGVWVNGGEAENASADLDLEAGKQYILVLEYYEATGGAAARLRWSGPGISKQAIWQGALMPPQCAISPWPVDRTVDVPDSAVLSFTPGPKAIAHTMYFGTNRKTVAASDASVALPPTDKTTYAPQLNWNTTYYWRVDETAADGTTIPGVVWSFTTANYVVIDSGQKRLDYNNTLAPFLAQIALDVPADLTKNGVTDLALRFQGQAATQGSFSVDAATGTYSVGGAGTDIWGNADQFTYAYKALEGDGTMTARVVSDDGKGANEWSKAGVMIRETLAAGSTHAFMPITAGGGNGRSFQRRLVADLASTNADGPAPKITAPYWVRIERKGNDFSGYVSQTGDPNSWVQVGAAVTIVMKDPVFIGLAVTAHVAGTVRTWTFDSVSTTGNVVPAGPFSAWEIINTVQNDPAPLYVAIEDKAGKVAAVTNANPAAVNTTVLDLWKIPMSAFAGVDLTNAAKLYISVGDGKPDGSGVMTFADIRVVKPVPVLPDLAAVDVTIKGDAVKGFPDYAGAWPAAEVPANAIDDSITTKYLNFGGKTQPPAGFSVTPAMGATVVTGLTFTSANDAADRDPVAWEIWGSNKSIDGPWELIAKGAIEDFARMPDWPRRWKNATPIGFVNILPYLHYKVSFTTLKRFVQANSVQIAEVEILGVPAPAVGATKVNFQSNSQGDKVVPEGYLPDYGLPFADQGNGYSYGWSRDINKDARDRNSKNSPDQRYDTFLHLQKGDPAVWEIAIANGKYQVFIVGGDPDNTDQMNSFDVEGVIVPDADGQGDRWDTYLVNVTVADGRLTIKPALGATPPASNSKISFVVINAQ